jgi:hypothetical protein
VYAAVISALLPPDGDLETVTARTRSLQAALAGQQV